METSNKRIRCVAVDDEPLALALLESYIAKTPFLELTGSFTNAFEALKLLQSKPVDLLFLDIQMPQITGLQVASAVDAFQTKVVFVTAFDQYALEGFRVDAVDYLLKPVSYLDFLRTAEKVRRMVEAVAEGAAVNGKDLEGSLSGGSTLLDPHGSLVVKSEYRLQKIKYDDILYLESLRDYVVITLENGMEIKTLSTLKGLEANLSAPFFRVHRSFLVNFSKVKVIERNSILFGKKLIPISEAYRKEVMEFFLKWRG